MIITLLDLPLELPRDSPGWTNEGDNLLTGLAEWIRRCRSLFLMDLNFVLISLGQTFEGGFSGLPDAEAHGAYAFCGLACLCILGDPHVMIPK